MFELQGWILEPGAWGTAYWLCFAFAAWSGLNAWTAMRSTQALPAILANKVVGLFMVGAGMAAVPMLIALAFPAALGQAIGMVLLGALMSLPGMLAIHLAYRIPRTATGLTIATGLIALALGSLMALSTWWYHREMRPILQARAALLARQDARRLAEPYILLNHAAAVSKAFPLAATHAPYARMLDCVRPVLAGLAERFRAEQRWPLRSTEVEAIERDARCDVQLSALGLDGDVRVTVLDPDPPFDPRPQYRNSGIAEPAPARAPTPKPPGAHAKPIQLTFYPHLRDDGNVLWLCAAEDEFEIFVKVQGCRGFKKGTGHRPDRR